MGELVLASMIALSWATAAVAVTLGRRPLSAHLAARVAAGMTGVGFVIAVAAAVLTLTTSSTQLELGASSVQLDPLSVLLSMLVFGLSALIQSFAVRYLRGDRRQGWFVGSATVLTAATVLLVCAASIVVFALAWLAAGASLIAALATYRTLPQAREGIRRTALRIGVADAGLVAGVGVLIVAGGGDRPLSDLASIADSIGEALGLTVSILLVIAALARSSQLPFQGWLPFTLAAPTPVSALMHAGVVNAGAILLVRFSPVISIHGWLMVAIAVVGGATVVWASAARLVRPDVKGRLVYSTMAQMGFMILACGLGAYAAAIFHLIAHSLFKSSLFLGAGQGVRRYLAELDQPVAQLARGWRRVLAVVIAIAVPVAGLVVAELLFAGAISSASTALLAFAATTGAITLGTALIGRFSLRTVIAGSAGMLLVVFAYIAFVTVFSMGLGSAGLGSVGLGSAGASAPAPAWLVALPAAALLALELLRHAHAPTGLSDRVYTRALTTASPRLSLTKGVLP